MQLACMKDKTDGSGKRIVRRETGLPPIKEKEMPTEGLLGQHQ